MGFAQFMKTAICRLQAAGKTKSEISGILEDAAERSTVNRGVIKEREPETALEPRNKQGDSLDSLCYAMAEAGITVEEAEKALERMRAAETKKPKHETNNWRRMHGIPMRRKQKRRTSRHGKGKRTDSRANNAEMA